MKRIKKFLNYALPLLLPVGILVVWLVRQCSGQLNDPTQIVASISADGSGRTYLSTILPDGNEAVWTCTAGKFLSTETRAAWGRNVTWEPDYGFEDSVTVIVTTPTVADSVSFLPIIPSLTPRLDVSCAYHITVLERARHVSLPPGTYTVPVTDENLSGYDGLIILLCHIPGGKRTACAVFPGDTLNLIFPLGAEIEAVAVDHMESALDNSGNVLVTFNRNTSEQEDSGTNEP